MPGYGMKPSRKKPTPKKQSGSVKSTYPVRTNRKKKKN